METRASWCPMWSDEQRKLFLSHVEEVVGTRYGEYAVDEGDGTVSVPSLDCVLGLSNLAQTCRTVDPGEWRTIVYNHIERLDGFSPDALSDKLSDYEQVRDDLRIRVVTCVHTDKVDAVVDPLPLGLSSCLSVDLGGAACPVDQGYFDGWGVERDEVMAVALANSLAADQLRAETAPELPGDFQVYIGESMFASAHLLDLARAAPHIGEMGAVVAVPAAHTVMVCPIDLAEPAEKFADSSATMLAASYIRYLAGPNSVSPNALWWRPDHPLEGFARMEQGFELVAPEPLRSHLRTGLAAEQEPPRPDAGLDL
ncbi:MAG: hypothetical protein F4153_10945 [Acidimicrobiia bacterium]|nr:hypothetical protein [Acidimicrobiia bacterium]